MTRPPGERPIGVESDALGRALDRVGNTRSIPGNAVTYLLDGPQAFGTMLALIEGARRWIHFENYIINDDKTGNIFAEHLIAAAGRGVEVRVLYDYVGSRRTSRSYWRRLRATGIHVRTFNRTNPLRPITSLRRDHRKYVGVDGTDAVLGGICIGDEWAGEPERDRLPWRDTAVQVSGPAVPALEWSFMRIWNATGGSTPAYAIPGKVDPWGRRRCVSSMASRGGYGSTGPWASSLPAPRSGSG